MTERMLMQQLTAATLAAGMLSRSPNPVSAKEAQLAFSEVFAVCFGDPGGGNVQAIKEKAEKGQLRYF